MMVKKTAGLSRIIKAFGYSFAGLREAFSEEAFRQECFLSAVLLPTAFMMQVSKTERILLIGSVFLILIVELMNTAIEKTIDRISQDHHLLSKKSKDMGSAAVFMAFVNAAMVWLVIVL